MNKQSGSWLVLVGFCVVTALAAALGFGILFAGGSVLFAVVQPVPASDETQPEPAQSSQALDRHVEATGARPERLMLVDDGTPVRSLQG